MNLDWMDDAACKGMHTNLFFPKREGLAGQRAAAEARAICRGCPVREQCLDYVLDGKGGWQNFGIYAGLTVKGRQRLRVERRQMRQAS